MQEREFGPIRVLAALGDSDSWGRATSQVTPGLLLLSLFALTESPHICGASVTEFVSFVWGHSWRLLVFHQVPGTGECWSPGGCEQRRHFNPCGTGSSDIPKHCLPSLMLTVSIPSVARPPLLSGTPGDSLALCCAVTAVWYCRACLTTRARVKCLSRFLS